MIVRRLTRCWLWFGGSLAALAALQGCGLDSFAPPRPEGLERPGSGASSARSSSLAGGSASTAGAAQGIELIEGSLNAADQEALTTIARVQAGTEGMRLQVSVAGDKGNPTDAPGLIKAALARKPRVIVLDLFNEFDPDNKETADLIDEARGKGIPFVILHRPGASDKDKKETSESSTTAGLAPRVYVTPESFDRSADTIVTAAIRNAKNAKLDPKDGAAIMINLTSDPLYQERVKALRGALTKAGIDAIDEVQFRDGIDNEIGRAHV